MTKNFKLVLALIVAIMMMTTSAFAATITINNAGNITSTHSYEVYQIFSGTQNEEATDASGKLSDIVWGAGVDGAALLTALQNDATIGSKFTSATTAEEVAKALQGATAEEMVAFSRVVATKLTATKAAEGNSPLTVNGDGYYFVKDVTAIAAGATDAQSAYIVQLVGQYANATLNIKTDAPKVEKKLKNHAELVAAYRDANNVGIGDIVDYQITSKVPNMENYKKYYFIVKDTLSKGLTFNADSLAITVGTKTLVPDVDYTLTTTPGTDSTAIEIVFKNFIQYQTSQPGANIEILYNATVNSNAEVGKNPNPNEVEIEYSNNPNKEGTGVDKPNPGEDDVTGTTPKDTTVTYSTNLKIKKTDGEGGTLDGVTFTITGYAKNNKITYTEEFVEKTGGDYWKLTDNTYTKIAPTTLTAGKYADQNKKYSLEIKADTTEVPVTYTGTGTTANGGVLDIGATINDNGAGLPAGTYVIHEDSTVSGYNILDHDIVVKVTNEITTDVADINFENPAKNTTITWKVEGEGAVVKDDGTIEITIENRSGVQLPETGGIGTTIFYVAGSLMVLAAAILLITKRRMGAND